MVTPQKLQDWLGALNMLLALGVPIAHLVTLVKSSLSAEDADVLLRQLLAGWQAAGTENEARIVELKALVEHTAWAAGFVPPGAPE